jgi:hypothetical protein
VPKARPGVTRSYFDVGYASFQACFFGVLSFGDRSGPGLMKRYRAVNLIKIVKMP